MLEDLGAWQLITEMGGVYFFLLVVALLLWGGRRRLAIGLSALLAFDLFLNAGLKVFFQAPRPPGAERLAYSFPSGHAQRVSALTGFLREPWLLILVVLVCLSRVVLGLHYWQDVVAGLVLGLVEGHLVRKLWDTAPADLEKKLDPYLFGVAAAFSLVGFGLAFAGFQFSNIVGMVVGLALGLSLKTEIRRPVPMNFAVGLAGFAALLYLAEALAGVPAFLASFLLGLWVSHLSIKAMNFFDAKGI